MNKEKQIEEMAEITSRDCGNCNNCKYVGMKGDGVDINAWEDGIQYNINTGEVTFDA